MKWIDKFYKISFEFEDIKCVPGLYQLERDIWSLAELYNENERSGGYGLGYYLCTQQKWLSGKILNYENIIQRLYSLLKQAIWRSEIRKKQKQQSEF